MRIRFTCVFTVDSSMNSASAISPLESPRATDAAVWWADDRQAASRLIRARAA
jgi:hypothetical protein